MSAPKGSSIPPSPALEKKDWPPIRVSVPPHPPIFAEYSEDMWRQYYIDLVDWHQSERKRLIKERNAAGVNSLVWMCTALSAVIAFAAVVGTELGWWRAIWEVLR